MKIGRDEIQWPRRVSKHKVRRLYESDAQGMLDAELVDDVGITLLLRCKAILEVAEAKRGRVRCPRCARQRKETVIRRVRAKQDPRDEVITCPECGWQVTWGEYAATYKRKQLNVGGAEGAFAAYVQGYEAARTPKARMLAIDRLIHEFHFSLRDKPWLPTRSVGPNLIQGKLTDILQFLDELTYGPDAAQEMWEHRADWLRNLETNWRHVMGAGTAADVLRRNVSPYFVDASTEEGIADMRADYTSDRDHHGWTLVQIAFDRFLDRAPKERMDAIVERAFNRDPSSLPGGAVGFLTRIHKEVFGERTATE